MITSMMTTRSRRVDGQATQEIEIEKREKEDKRIKEKNFILKEKRYQSSNEPHDRAETLHINIEKREAKKGEQK